MSDFDELWDKKFGKAPVEAKVVSASQGKSFDDLWSERFGTTTYTEPPKVERPFQPAPPETISVAPNIVPLGTKPSTPESLWTNQPPVTVPVQPISVARPITQTTVGGRIAAEWQIPPGPAGEGMALKKKMGDITQALSLGVKGTTPQEFLSRVGGAVGPKEKAKIIAEQVRAIPEETGQWVGEAANLMDKYANTPGPIKTPWDRMPEQVKNLPGSMARLAAGIVQFPVDVLAKVGGLSIEQAGDLADKAQRGDMEGLGKSMRNYALWDSPIHQTLFDVGEQIATPAWQTSAYMSEKAGIPSPLYAAGKFVGVQKPSEEELQAVEEMAVKRPTETAAGQFMAAAPFLGILGKSKLGKLTPKEAGLKIATKMGERAGMHLDELTGLPNQKTHFRELRKTEGAVGILDADNFKGLKERFKENAEGAGDEILRQVGTRLNEIAGRYGVKVSRRGGEEFGVWKEGMTAEELAPTLEAIRKELSTTPYTVLGEDVPITFSGGVGDINTKNLKMPDEAANIAMKQAKASGKNQSIVAERRLGTRLPEKGGMAFKVGDEIVTGANEGNLAQNALDRGLWEKSKGLPREQIQAGFIDEAGKFVADKDVHHEFNNAIQALLWERSRAEAPKAPVAGKEPWRGMTGNEKLLNMTRDEVTNNIQTGYGPKGARDLTKLLNDHKKIVERAIVEGMEVRPEVLADYPDLAGKVASGIPARERARLAEAQLLSETGGAPVGAGLTTQPGIPPTLEPSIPITPRGPKLTWRQEANNLYTDLINRFDPVERAVKGAISRGVEFAKGMNPTERMREYLGIGGKVKTTLRDGVFRIDEKTGNRVLVSEGYEPIIKDFQKETGKNNRQAEAEANDYLIANRYIQDLQRKSGRVAKYESELFDDITKTQEKVDDLRGKQTNVGELSGGEKQRLATLEDRLNTLQDKAGSLKNIASEKQVADALKTVADLKVKYKGDLSAFEKMSSRVYEFQKNILHQLVDSGRMDEGVFQKIVSENPHYIPFDRVFEAEGIEALPTEGTPRAKGIFTRISQPVKEIKGSERGIHNTLETVIRNTYKILDESERNTVKRSIAKLADVIPDEVSIVSEKQRIPGNHFVDFYEGGQKQTMKVSSEIFKAMEGLDNVSSNMLVRFMAKPATWLRRGATTTLEFIGRNPMRDQWSAFTQTNVGYVPFVDLYKGVSHILKNDEIYKAWQSSGGSQSGFVELSRPNLTKIYQSIMHDKPLLQKLNIVTSLEDLSMLMEQGTRVGVFEKAKAKGLSDVQAGFVSREASTDFARIGAQMKSANQMISFLNANIQGSNRALRGWKQNPKAYTVKAIASITIPSVLLYLKNRDDPLYRELPQWDRDVFWHFRVGDTFYRIPKPFLEGAVFGSSVERFLGFAEGKDPHAMDGLFNLIVGAASPFNELDPTSGIIPTALRPIVENATPRGWSFFRKQPLIPQSRENVEPYLQYGPYTSETAKFLGKATNKSPAKIENLVRGYTGGLGGYALGLGDLAIQTATGFQKPHRPYELSDVPGISGFVSRNPLVAPQSLGDFYDNLDAASKAEKSQKAIANERGEVEGETYRINHPEIDIYPDLVSIQNEIKNVTDQIDEVVQRGDIADKDKRSILNELYWMRLNLAKQGNEIFRSTEQKSSLIPTTPQ